ncbi:LuxR C-terminal-related transcriptional regulator [Massilia sp. CF038]|uniref:LuxR C-terminal-related transcriptional regulator n=1 Tax=Massilia sp. CF038 TaxID=1881045 RepID=UPI000912EB32|nr:LuxR C-terminal-related transcriptional regulator [Massilia sp. CF038]SHH14243.1 transcriptional regulator, LuxR family [Massilia sp. CF038]
MSAFPGLNAREQEYLLGIVETAVAIHSSEDFFLWCQGHLQALLPHTLLIGLQFDASGALRVLETVHPAALPADWLARWSDPQQALVPALARQWHGAPLAFDAGSGAAHGPALDAALAASGCAEMLLHGSGPAAGGASAVLLFGPAGTASARARHCLHLLLPYFHLALGRLALARPAPMPVQARLARSLSERELQILNYLHDGKKNAEIASLLGISALTVKNHLQRIYPVLGARNRTAAVARSHALQLLRRM